MELLKIKCPRCGKETVVTHIEQQEHTIVVVNFCKSCGTVVHTAYDN